MQQEAIKKLFTYFVLLTGQSGLVIQFLVMLQTRQTSLPEAIIRFFSYFTILSNIMVVGYFFGHLLPPPNRFKKFVSRPETATAVSIYIIVVGVVYQIILRQPVPLTGWHRVADDILHLYIPLLMLIYWIVAISDSKINTRTIPYWLIYPAAYFAYTMLRGSVADFYPYPFVAVNKLGYNKVFLNSAMLVVFFLVLSYVFAGISNWRYLQTHNNGKK